MTYHIFIDESCHLASDSSTVMCIGSIVVPENEYADLQVRLAAFKDVFKQHAEIKWVKFSKSRMPLYKSLIDFFFETNLQFRCVLIKYKNRLLDTDFADGSHENFYYKMIEYLLRSNDLNQEYRVFLDIINSRGRERLDKIQQSLAENRTEPSPFISLQHLHSHHNVFFELADLFVGAVAYSARKVINEVPDNPAKNELLSYLEEKSGYCLNESTEPWEKKFVIIDHQPKSRKV